MKLSVALLTIAAVADKKVPPRHPLQRLNKLVKFSEELLNDWYGFLPSRERWIGKFDRNAQRMRRNFERGNQKCGVYEDEGRGRGRRATETTLGPLRYDQNDPAVGTKQITTGFSKWAQRYLSACSGQKKFNYQVNRMNNWNGKLQTHLERYYNQTEGSGFDVSM